MIDEPCHWIGEYRARGPKHDGDHADCQPCPHRHCVSEHCRTHVDLDVLTCPRCIGRTRTMLAEIGAMHGRLEDEALHHPNDPIPGGVATVLAGPSSTSTRQQWADEVADLIAATGRPRPDTTHKRDELASDPIPTLLVLATWEDAGRDILGAAEGPRPATVESAIDWLTRSLTDLAQHDAWPQLADDIRKAHSKLEAVLQDGTWPVRGAPCLSVECDGGTLYAHYQEPNPCEHDTEAKRHARALVRRRHDGEPVETGTIRAALRAARAPCEHCDQGGRRDKRECSKCGRVYDETEYHRATAQEAAQHDPLRTVPEIARTLGVKRDRVNKWVARGKLKPKGHTMRGVAEYDIREARGLAMRSDVA